MFGVDKIALIRRAHFSDGKKIKEIVRELAVSRKVVRKVVRSGATDFTYIRQVQPRPQLGSFTDRLEALLAEDAARPRRDRRTLRRIADLLRQDEAALELPWSNGQAEGQITRLKLIKRQMYGRAKFDLLRARVLQDA